MEALAVLHEDKVYHRDIAPDNIMLLAGDRPVLLDFGAARRVISDMTHALTVILKPGYAPIEQYADMPGMKQGPWTDVYALAAVVYFMILKRKPPPAVGRLMEDSYEPLMKSEAAGRYSDQLLRGIDKCLSVRAPDRPQSMTAMREALGLAAIPAVAEVPVQARPPRKKEPTFDVPESEIATEIVPQAVDVQLPERAETAAEPAKRSKAPLAIGAALGLAMLVAGYAYFARPRAPAAAGAAPAVAVAPVVKTPPTAPAVASPPAPPVPRIASLNAAFDAALAGADPQLATTLEAPASVPLGSDLKVVVRSKSEGLLYLFVWDQATDKVYRSPLNEKEGGNAIKADASVTVTHNDAANPAAKQAPGNWRVVSMLSERPRDFSSAAFGRDGDAQVVERSALEARLAADGLPALFGTSPCTAGQTCQDRYAIAMANIAREAAAPSPSAGKRAPAPKTAAANPPAKKSTESEREYMKRLNKDLDNLLGK
jgi:hypothetical protein